RRQNLGAAQPWHLLHTDPSLTPKPHAPHLPLSACSPQNGPLVRSPALFCFLWGRLGLTIPTCAAVRF
ncbi:hypothetical protein H8957_017552, partial [Semnopithecus entellus]